ISTLAVKRDVQVALGNFEAAFECQRKLMQTTPSAPEASAVAKITEVLRLAVLASASKKTDDAFDAFETGMRRNEEFLDPKAKDWQALPAPGHVMPHLESAISDLISFYSQCAIDSKRQSRAIDFLSAIRTGRADRLGQSHPYTLSLDAPLEKLRAK
ncbi:MAG TPA: hypothetical protein VHC70_13075, partial [Phycisphaerales bacterium]|nr:hypothetical protein [Phycisphaerales bacterium]